MPLAYYITDRHSCSLPILQQIQQAIDASVDFIQIREKDLATRPLLELAARALELAKGSRSKILINDRLDIALAERLDGIHLGHHSVETSAIRKQLGEMNLLIGASVHSMDDFLLAAAEGASFVTLGPIFATPSKSAYGPPLGLELLKAVCRRASTPVFALGGIGLENYQSCLAAGAGGIAAIRLFQMPETLDRAVHGIHDFLFDR
ncbi:MAG: thiamine phosphate synthase [Terriglobia bacterium]